MPSVTLRTKAIQKKGFSLYLDIYNEGTRYKEYLKLYVSKDYTLPANKKISAIDKDSWGLAKAIHARRLLELKDSAAGFVSKTSNQDFIVYFKRQLEVKNHATYNNALRHMINHHGKEHLSFKLVNEQFLKGYIHYLKGLELSNNTIRIYLMCLNIILNQAVTERIIATNPFVFFKRGKQSEIPRKKQARIQYLTIEELRILNNTEYRRDVKEYFLFSCFTGLRESDIRKLRWSDIKENILTYSQKKQQDNITHYLPLSQEALNLLQKIRETQIQMDTTLGELVFAHAACKQNINKFLKKWASEAGIEKNIHMHVGRHTFATLALTNGVSLYTVSKMLGHSNTGITQIYAEVIDKVKQQAADLIPRL